MTKIKVDTPRVELYEKAKAIAKNNGFHSKIPAAFKEACLQLPTKLIPSKEEDDVSVVKYNIIATNIEKLFAQIPANNKQEKLNETGT